MPLTRVQIALTSSERPHDSPTLAAQPAEPVSFDEVFRQYAPFVWRALRRLAVRPADLDDVCQEVFVVVHRRLPTFAGRSSIRTWVYGICIRVARDYRRRPQHRREEVCADPPEGVMPAPQDDDLDRRRTLARLDAALDQLDEDKRAVFVLYELEQIPMAEIAEAVGCPLHTAYARLYAARRIIEAALREAVKEGSAR